MLGNVIEDSGLMLDARNIYLVREDVFGSDPVVTGRIYMEVNLTFFNVFQLFLIISVFDTVVGTWENYLFKAINLLSISINFFFIL